MWLDTVLAQLAGSLIVSCQPVLGGPLDRPDIVVGFSLAALAGGAKGLRIEGIDNVMAVRAATSAPIIGLIKRDLSDSPVRITPFVADVEALAKAGADIIAFDATDRTRSASGHALCEAAHSLGKIAMADISSVAEARAAIGFGADLIGTTMSGYTGGAEPDEPDLHLLAEAAKLRWPIIAEGRIRTPAQAASAIRAGAFSVVVGSAITRPEHITSWFAGAIHQAGPAERKGAAT